MLCTDEGYRGLYARVGLEVVVDYRPLATGDEGWPWVSETRVAPWVTWVLKSAR